MRSLILGLGLALSVAFGAAAEPVDEDTARKALFNTRGETVEYVAGNGLSEADEAWVDALTEQLDRGGQVDLSYYGAIAVSPTMFSVPPAERPNLIVRGLLQFVNGANSPGGAQGLALRLCNDARGGGDAPCVVAAVVLPRRFSQQPLYLSPGATEAFREYRRMNAPKAFAASPTTAFFGLASGTTAVSQALASCGLRGANDCEIVIQD
jgi:hypothetical protein